MSASTRTRRHSYARLGEPWRDLPRGPPPPLAANERIPLARSTVRTRYWEERVDDLFFSRDGLVRLAVPRAKLVNASPGEPVRTSSI
jgi:hypothetical protein